MNSILRSILVEKTDHLTPGQRAIHTHVIGQPGTGKSHALESWIMQDVLAGRGVGVIDPHGDLFKRLQMRLAMIPEVWRKVVMIDPCDPKWTVIFNPLEAIQGFSQERLSLFMTDVIVKIWSLDAASSPRMIWLLTHCFLALSNLGLTILDLPRFLLDRRYRESLLPALKHEDARAYFQFEFPRSQGAIHQWVTPVLNKIGGLVFDPDVRLMMAGSSTIDFRTIMDQKNILLVNLPKGIIGEGASGLIGAFVVAHLQKAALSRANSGQRIPFYLYLDEFQNYTTDNVKDVLSESRKYALSLILAHQYLDQLSPDLLGAVLNTAGTLACFRVGFGDALRLAKEIFPSPDFLKTKSMEIKMDRFASWPLLSFSEKCESIGWEGSALELTRLKPREFWARHSGSATPKRYRTISTPDVTLTPEVLSGLGQLVDASGQQFGRLKKEVQRQLEENRRKRMMQNGGSDASSEDSDGLFWRD